MPTSGAVSFLSRDRARIFRSPRRLCIRRGAPISIPVSGSHASLCHCTCGNGRCPCRRGRPRLRPPSSRSRVATGITWLFGGIAGGWSGALEQSGFYSLPPISILLSSARDGHCGEPAIEGTPGAEVRAARVAPDYVDLYAPVGPGDVGEGTGVVLLRLSDRPEPLPTTIPASVRFPSAGSRPVLR